MKAQRDAEERLEDSQVAERGLTTATLRTSQPLLSLFSLRFQSDDTGFLVRGFAQSPDCCGYYRQGLPSVLLSRPFLILYFGLAYIVSPFVFDCLSFSRPIKVSRTGPTSPLDLARLQILDLPPTRSDFRQGLL